MAYDDPVGLQFALWRDFLQMLITNYLVYDSQDCGLEREDNISSLVIKVGLCQSLFVMTMIMMT